ncbi:extracellular solute-binding protein [Mesorhizobium atlanticum]
MISRRAFLATTAAAAMAGTFKTQASSFEGQTLRVQFWGGSDGLAIQKYIVDPFMKATGAKVVVEEGVTSASIAKVTAQKNDPQIDVALLDDVGVFALNRQGLLDKIDLSKVPNAKDVYPRFILDEGFGVGFWTYITTILNNTKSPSPTSWEDLWSPAYQGKLLVPSINDTQALLLTVMAAQLGGGSLENLAPALAEVAGIEASGFLLHRKQGTRCPGAAGRPGDSSGRYSHLLQTIHGEQFGHWRRHEPQGGLFRDYRRCRAREGVERQPRLWRTRSSIRLFRPKRKPALPQTFGMARPITRRSFQTPPHLTLSILPSKWQRQYRCHASTWSTRDQRS